MDHNAPAVARTSDDTASDEHVNVGMNNGVGIERDPAGLGESSKAMPANKARPSVGIQERLITMLWQQIVPDEAAQDNDDPLASMSRASPSRPAFSLPLMTNNFRRFNARIGVLFAMQARAFRVLTWASPTQTLSFLAVYTFICLNPYLAALIPSLSMLLFVLVPSFVARHPPPPKQMPIDFYSPYGPPIAPAVKAKPPNDIIGKDFFRNLRELQNLMDDFSLLYDAVATSLDQLTNFADESRSSAVFLVLFLLTCAMFFVSSLLPWRFIFLAAGWVVTALGHPAVQARLLSSNTQDFKAREEQTKTRLLGWVEREFAVALAPDTHETEVFELQRRNSVGEWEAWVFSPSPYDPLEPERVSRQGPPGTRFLEDVQPPLGWEWSDKFWSVDLLSQDWVGERCISSVKVELEGERWVSDLPLRGQDSNAQDEKRTTGANYHTDIDPLPDADDCELWRRRRWVRRVRRKAMTKQA